MGAEFVGPPERRVLLGDVAPQRPDAALADLRVEDGCGVVAAPVGVFHEGAVGDEDQVALREVKPAGLAVPDPFDPPCHFALGGDVEPHVGHPGVVLNGDAMLLEPGDQREDEGLVLVVPGELQDAEIGQSADRMDEALEVPLHFEGAMPLLEREHRPPVQPEIAVQEVLAQHIGDLLVVQVLVAAERQLGQVSLRSGRQGQPAVRGIRLAAILRSASQRVVGVVLVEPVELVEHRSVVHLQRRDRAEQIPQALEAILHLSPAADEKTLLRVFDTVQGATGKLGCL